MRTKKSCTLQLVQKSAQRCNGHHARLQLVTVALCPSTAKQKIPITWLCICAMCIWNQVRPFSLGGTSLWITRLRSWYHQQERSWYYKQLRRWYQAALQQPLSQAEYLRPILIEQLYRSTEPCCALGIVTCLIFLRTSLIGNQALTHAGWYQAALLYVAGTEPCCRTVIDWYQNEQELAGASALLLSCEFGGKNLANYVGKKHSIYTCHAWVLHVLYIEIRSSFCQSDWIYFRFQLLSTFVSGSAAVLEFYNNLGRLGTE
jgi:hypothetical protein